MGGKIVRCLMITAVLALCLAPVAGAAKGGAPGVQKNCLKCHQKFGEMPDVLAGNLGGTSLKANTIQMKIGSRMEMVKFTPDTKIANIPDMKALKSGMALRVHYNIQGSDKVATEIVVKPKIEVPEEQMMGVKELAKLVAMGPQKGGYTLVDSRPGAGYQKGHIPTAISIPFPKMKKMLAKLPQDKDSLIIFYCQGYR